MNQYITGALVKKLREQKKLTQLELAQKLCVSDKTVSKWENGKGYPDISLLEPLAGALGVSVAELLSGDSITNKNRSCRMDRMKFYICPICGNIVCATGEAAISCCGISLLPAQAEPLDKQHPLKMETVEDEYFITIDHEMTKQHYISFIAVVRDDGYSLIKLYPEQNAQARVKIQRTSLLYYYCNRHGLYGGPVRNFR